MNDFFPSLIWLLRDFCLEIDVASSSASSASFVFVVHVFFWPK